MVHVHIAEYIVFGVLMTANLGIGLYFALYRRGRHTDTDETFLGSRSLGVLPLSLSILASMVTAIGIVGFTAHFYVYGMHLLWASVTVFVLVPFISRVIIPLIYKLGITSVFQYLRMRFGNKVGITASLFYFIVNQIQGAVSIFAAGVAISTSFHVPLVWSSLSVGLAGTVYTALGGLRGVVWTDTMQGILILICPLTIMFKILYDSLFNPFVDLRPISDIDVKPYIFEASFDLTSDENVWACMIGLIAAHIYRMGMDQMIVQRYAAARSLRDAQRSVITGSILLVTSYVFLAAVAMSLIYWFRDCDPILSGTIKKIEQLVPYYVDRNLSGAPGFSGFFLTGVVSATLSTVSSVINSLAASFYIDVLSPYIHIKEANVNLATKGLAFAFGALMTTIAVLVPYIGSAVRIIMGLHSSAAGPLVGLYLLALAFPWANSKGAAVSTVLAMALQMWALTGKLMSGIRPPRMPVTLDSCPGNITVLTTNATSALMANSQRDNIFPLYRMSSYWGGLLSMLLTLVIGLTVSILTGGGKNAARHYRLTSDAFVALWRKLRLITDDFEEADMTKDQDKPTNLFVLSDVQDSVDL